MEGHEMELDMTPKQDPKAERSARIEKNVDASLPFARLAVEPKEWGKVDGLAEDIKKGANENGEEGAIAAVNKAKTQDEAEVNAKQEEKMADLRARLALAA